MRATALILITFLVCTQTVATAESRDSPKEVEVWKQIAEGEPLAIPGFESRGPTGGRWSGRTVRVDVFYLVAPEHWTSFQDVRERVRNHFLARGWSEDMSGAHGDSDLSFKASMPAQAASYDLYRADFWISEKLSRLRSTYTFRQRK